GGGKKAEIQRLLARYRDQIESERVRVLFMDECHLMAGDLEGYIWGRRGQRVEVPIVNEREPQTDYGAIDLSSQRVFVV
ncbi:MAG: IS630 family transposase, partial [Phormidesmis sp. RL_2_1]|nr:IS630 family transposase [Phormidesmis sp. RL_2_1]